MRSFIGALACGLSLLTAGCGGSDSYEYAPVSGTVTLDGQPLADANLLFQPQRSGNSANPGPPSYATTNAQGKFSLTTTAGPEGAVVGPHYVTITTEKRDLVADTVVQKEILPPRYHLNSELSFEVPPDGSSTADFPLTSK